MGGLSVAKRGRKGGEGGSVRTIPYPGTRRGYGRAYTAGDRLLDVAVYS